MSSSYNSTDSVYKANTEVVDFSSKLVEKIFLGSLMSVALPPSISSRGLITAL